MPAALAFLLLAAAASVSWITELGGKAEMKPGGPITAVSFRSTWIEDSDLPRLAALPELRSLDLAHTRVTDIGFRSLAPLRQIQELDLYYAELTGDGVLNVARNWKTLRRLNLRGTKVTDAGVAQLAEHPALEALDVGFSLFTDGGFEALTTLPKLRELAVGGNKITDAGLNYLRLLPNLRVLDLAGTQRTDSGPWSVTVTDRSMDTLATLTALEELNLRGAKMTSAGAARLTALKSLRRLDVGETQITSADLASILPAMPHLTRLSLYKCRKVDDKAVPALAAAARSLDWMDVTGSAITEAGAKKLRESNPKLRVMWQQP